MRAAVFRCPHVLFVGFGVCGADERRRIQPRTLAWWLRQAPNVIPIPGSHRIARLKSHSASTDISLHADDIARLDRLLDPASVAGAGYPEAGLAGLAGGSGMWADDQTSPDGWHSCCRGRAQLVDNGELAALTCSRPQAGGWRLPSRSKG